MYFLAESQTHQQGFNITQPLLNQGKNFRFWIWDLGLGIFGTSSAPSWRN